MNASLSTNARTYVGIHVYTHSKRTHLTVRDQVLITLVQLVRVCFQTHGVCTRVCVCMRLCSQKYVRGCVSLPPALFHELVVSHVLAA